MIGISVCEICVTLFLSVILYNAECLFIASLLCTSFSRVKLKVIYTNRITSWRRFALFECFSSFVICLISQFYMHNGNLKILLGFFISILFIIILVSWFIDNEFRSKLSREFKIFLNEIPYLVLLYLF